MPYAELLGQGLDLRAERSIADERDREPGRGSSAERQVRALLRREAAHEEHALAPSGRRVWREGLVRHHVGDVQPPAPRPDPEGEVTVDDPSARADRRLRPTERGTIEPGRHPARVAPPAWVLAGHEQPARDPRQGAEQAHVRLERRHDVAAACGAPQAEHRPPDISPSSLAEHGDVDSLRYRVGARHVFQGDQSDARSGVRDDAGPQDRLPLSTADRQAQRRDTDPEGGGVGPGSLPTLGDGPDLQA
jgi:hypothetical protein